MFEQLKIGTTFQQIGTAAAAKKAHERAEADYKRARTEIQKLLRETEKALRVSPNSIDIREDLVIVDTFNASTRDLRKATNVIRKLIYDGRRKQSRDEIRNWATAHNQAIKPFNDALSLAEIKKTAIALDKEEAKMTKTLEELPFPKIAQLVKDEQITYESEKKLNSYVSNKALKTLRSRTRSTKKSTQERLAIMGSNAKVAWSQIDDDTITGNANYGFSTVVYGIHELSTLSDYQLGGGIYVLLKAGIISDIELKKLFASDQKKLAFDTATYNALIDYFNIDRKYYIFFYEFQGDY